VVTITKSILINRPVEIVFAYVDDIKNTGWHMTKSSMPLMGGHLNLETVSGNDAGTGATYRWWGKVFGLTMDFTETVTEWEENKKRVWETIGQPKLIIMDSYIMSFEVTPKDNSTLLVFKISYELPRNIFNRFLGLILSGWYSNWCLNNMCADTKTALES